MKIKVKNSDGKIIQIFINNFDKCCVLKKKIEKGYGIVSNQQKLLYNDELIDNDRILRNYGIKDGCVIELLIFNHKFPITVNPGDGKYFHVEVDAFDTVTAVKCEIAKLNMIPIERQQLFYNNIALMDNNSLFDSGIKGPCFINLVCSRVIKVFISENNEEIVGLEIEMHEYVSQLKQLFMERFGRCSDGKFFIYNDLLLEDDKLINEYRIEDGSKIVLIPQMNENNEEIIELEIEMREYVSQLKQLFMERFGRCSDGKFFIYNDLLLEDDKLINEYGIEDGSKIVLIPQMKTLNVTIYMTDGKCFILQVDPNQSVYRLKCEINELYGVPIIDQDLLYKDQLLDDNHSLLQSGIFRPSYIGLIINGIEIFVCNSDDEYLPYQVNRKDTIKNIKQFIQKRTNLNLDNQKLVFNEIIMNDDKSLCEYGIVDGSRITLAC